MKIYKSRGHYYRHRRGMWQLLCFDRWVWSEDANNVASPFHEPWLDDLKLVANNFKLK